MERNIWSIIKYRSMKGAEMDYSSLTVGGCTRKQEQEGIAAVIENGTITGSVEEKSPYQRSQL